MQEPLSETASGSFDDKKQPLTAHLAELRRCLVISFGASILAMESPWHRAMLALLGGALAYFLWRVPVRQSRPRHIRSQ